MAGKIVRSAETRAKIAAAHRGMKHSPETKAKLSAIASRNLRGHTVSAETRERISAAQRGAAARQWAGDAVGYLGAHKRHRAELPRCCAHCGTTEGLLDAALRKDADPWHLLGCVRRRRLYSPFTVDYVRLCRRCHIAYDRGVA